MNISTATLLNLLSPKTDSTVKDKLNSLSVDGKINLETVSKDKGIQTLLTGLFKDIASDAKTKENIAVLLQNNKQNFSFKNLSEDIKTLVKTIEVNPTINSKLQAQLSGLKASLLDMKNIDQKSIKTNINNSGVLLESKLAQQIVPVSKNIEQLVSLLKTQLEIKTALPMQTQIPNNIDIAQIQTKLSAIESNLNIPKDLKQEIKNAIESLLRDIKNIQNQKEPLKQLLNFSTLETKITTIQQNQNLPLIKSDILTNIKDLILNLKEQISGKNLNNIKNILTQIEQKITPLVEQNITAKSIKSDISNIFEQLKSLGNNKAIQQPVVLQNILNNTQVIQTKIETLPQALFENNLSKTANFINDIKITASIVEEQIRNSNEPIAKDLKAIVDKINTQIEFFQLLSYSTNSTHTYLSFLQDEIEDSDIRFNKNEDSFSCQINLTLKQYGDIKILMILDDKQNININIGLEKDEFKSLIQENLQKLRIGINSINLMLQSLNVFNLNDNEHKSIKNSYANSTNEFSFGLDIKA